MFGIKLKRMTRQRQVHRSDEIKHTYSSLKGHLRSYRVNQVPEIGFFKLMKKTYHVCYQIKAHDKMKTNI